MGFESLGVLYGAGGIGSCLVALLLLYNLVSAVLFLREETDGVASPMAKAAWAVGVLAVLGWWFPCVGAVLAIAAIVLAQVERGRIYRDESTFAGSTPIRMGRIDGIIVLIVQLILIGGMVASAVRGGMPTIE
jgi:hypothetical protein